MNPYRIMCLLYVYLSLCFRHHIISALKRLPDSPSFLYWPCAKTITPDYSRYRFPACLYFHLSPLPPAKPFGLPPRGLTDSARFCWLTCCIPLFKCWFPLWRRGMQPGTKPSPHCFRGAFAPFCPKFLWPGRKNPSEKEGGLLPATLYAAPARLGGRPPPQRKGRYHVKSKDGALPAPQVGTGG